MTLEQATQRLTHTEIVALLASHQAHQALQESHRALQASHEAVLEQVERLKHQLDWFKKQLFGSKSERRLIEMAPNQMSLGEELERAAAAAVAATRQIAAHTRRVPLKSASEEADEREGLKFDDTVPVEVIEMSDPDTAALSADQYEVIGEKETYRLAQRPGSYVVLKFVRRVIKRKEDGAISCPPAPPVVLGERSWADVSFLAGLLIDKFRYHLPLYRQHQRLLDAGIEVSRAWLTQLVHRTAQLLEPIYEAQRISILESAVIAMDESPIKAGQHEKGKLQTTFFWPVYGDRNEVVFPWFRSRAAPHVKEVLGEYRGTLLTDGYAAYEHYVAANASVTHAQCWAHARRTFVDAEGAEPELVATALGYIRALYAEEETIRAEQLSGKQKLAHRVERCKPIVEAFFAWCEQRLLDQGLLPTNPLTQALAYSRERQAGLSVFLADPEVPIDTNHLERALRPIPLGRRNWLFCWTEVGAKYVGIVQSLLVTCRLHGVAPYDYLVDVLQRIDRHPAADVAALTPRLWKERFATDPLRSPLGRRQ